jgi:hypothetical protein
MQTTPSISARNDQLCNTLISGAKKIPHFLSPACSKEGGVRLATSEEEPIQTLKPLSIDGFDSYTQELVQKQIGTVDVIPTVTLLGSVLPPIPSDNISRVKNHLLENGTLSHRRGWALFPKTFAAYPDDEPAVTIFKPMENIYKSILDASLVCGALGETQSLLSPLVIDTDDAYEPERSTTSQPEGYLYLKDTTFSDNSKGILDYTDIVLFMEFKRKDRTVDFKKVGALRKSSFPLSYSSVR